MPNDFYIKDRFDRNFNENVFDIGFDEDKHKSNKYNFDPFESINQPVGYDQKDDVSSILSGMPNIFGGVSGKKHDSIIDRTGLYSAKSREKEIDESDDLSFLEKSEYDVSGRLKTFDVLSKDKVEQSTVAQIKSDKLLDDDKRFEDWKLEKEYRDIYLKWKENPTQENAEELYRKISPIVNKAVKLFVGSDPPPQLVSKAKALAMNAIKNYDPKKAQLNTYLMIHLQVLMRHAAEYNRPIHVPERVAMDWKLIQEKISEFKDEYGREPSDSELADATGLSIKRIEYVRKMRAQVAEGAYSPEAGSDEDSAFDPAVRNVNMEAELAWAEFVYQDLSPIDQVIMEHTLGLHGKPILSNEEIARKLNITPSAVSQRKAKIQELLNKREEYGVF